MRHSLRARPILAQPPPPHPVSPHGLVNVLQVALAQVLHAGVQAVGQAVAHAGGYDCFAGAGQGGQAGGQVDACAVDIELVGVDLAAVDAGAQVHVALGALACVGAGDGAVQCLRGVDGIARLLKLHHHAVAQAFDQAAVVLGNGVVFGLLHKAVPARHGARLVGRHQPHRFHQINHQHHLLAAGQGQLQKKVCGLLRIACRHGAGIWHGAHPQ